MSNLIPFPTPSLPPAPGKQITYRCLTCLDSGIVQAVHREKGGAPYAFICWCERGAGDRRNLPRWHANLSKDYEVCE
jgi:hypothetical protein